MTSEERPKREHYHTHFKRRLEAFSDIVFGLCLAQSAVQLGLPATSADLISGSAIVRYLIFFATFALIAFYWFSHYRMFRLAFEPYPLDVVLNFVFLALTAMLPFTMQANIKFGNGAALGFYAANLGLASLVMAILSRRGLERRDPSLTADERLAVWRGVLRGYVVVAASLVALVLIAIIPSPWQGMAGFVFVFMGPFMAYVRKRVTNVPSRYLLQ